jgi:hypothetical protein
MNLTKRQKMQLEFWKKFHGVKKPTVLAFLRAQRPLWWFAVAVLLVSFVAYEIMYGNPELVVGFMIATLVYGVGMYFRFRLDWSLVDHCLDWEKIGRVQQGAPPDALNDGARQ